MPAAALRAVATFLACVVSLAAVGCRSESAAASDTSGDRDAASTDDTSGQPGLEGGTSAIVVPPSQGTWQADRDVTLTGAGAGDLGAISLVHGVGSLTFQGAQAPAFYFAGTGVPLGDAGADSGLHEELDLEIVAAQPGRLVLAWVTCYGPELAYVYYETTDGLATTASTQASGACDVLDAGLAEPVTLPGVAIAPPEVVAGFSVAGPQLSYDGTGPGTAVFADETWAAYPFHLIDCTGCAAQGWYELHTLFSDPAQSHACAGILYLYPSTPSFVELAYLLCLPTVTSPLPAGQIDFASSWQHPQ